MNRLKGMSALASHPETKTIEEQISVFAGCGFDSFFLSTGVTDQFKKIPFGRRLPKNMESYLKLFTILLKGRMLYGAAEKMRFPTSVESSK